VSIAKLPLVAAASRVPCPYDALPRSETLPLRFIALVCLLGISNEDNIIDLSAAGAKEFAVS
jgi:hypothetical protein